MDEEEAGWQKVAPKRKKSGESDGGEAKASRVEERSEGARQVSEVFPAVESHVQINDNATTLEVTRGNPLLCIKKELITKVRKCSEFVILFYKILNQTTESRQVDFMCIISSMTECMQQLDLRHAACCSSVSEKKNTSTLCLLTGFTVTSSLNVAPSGTASQSSTYGGWVASNAIDGSRNPNGISCTHTGKTEKSWWRLILPAMYRITSVSITNRNDVPERINNAMILIGNCPMNNGNDNPM
ncbi:Fucolectin-3 [Liparis tanakae]|uniref:Fucolectin-3 n=1 Tax=Liparis tanakae TaxID=230148 RepID=A0A4Z2HP77_9TELE|nr:Fucolectin-3 [Liparis tanakae]